MKHYLLRFIETGRDAQRGKQPRDLENVLGKMFPDARTEAVHGRLFVETHESAEAFIGLLHGVSSFSPCQPSSVEELPARVAELSLGDAQSFAIKVRRFGNHDFSSLEMARRLAAVILQRHPGLRVDLKKPDITIGVEIRDGRAWLYDRVIPGIERRGASLPTDSPVRFLADQMLGRLAAWLRMLGFDTTYAFDIADSEVVRRAHTEGRIVLTRDRPLSRNRAVQVLYVNPRTVEAQVREVLVALQLTVQKSDLFSRCALCNGPLEAVEKVAVADRVPPSAFAHYDKFAICLACDKVYWAGSHYQRVLEAVGDLIE